MSKEAENLTTAQIYAAPIPNAAAQHIAAAKIVAFSGSGANPHAIVNAHNLAEKKKKIIKAHFDKTGQTLPTTAIILAMDADRNIRHSRALASNINKANRGQCRPQETDAHHIVGRLDFRAEVARRYLFAWLIGINDADNGVYLPRYARTKIASMLKAHHHQGLHTDDYYFNVEMRLRSILGQPTAIARVVLRTIKNELIAGTFPF